jgi:serine/threonine-protein kinase
MSDDKNIPEILDIEPVDQGGSGSGSSGSKKSSGSSKSSSGRRSRGSKPDPLVGKMLMGRYELTKKVGEGGMGNVYLAVQQPLNREVAVKLLKPSENNPEGEHYFMREVQAINMLRHPNIIGILDFGKEDDGTLFLVMEYLPGRTLKRVIRKEFPLDPVRICDICIQVLSALEQAHQTQIVHCDLKPANIMLERVAGQDDFAKVLDFGIAKVKGPAMEVGPYTQAGNIVGTFDYMSPEQIMRKELDGRADIWSMGVIMYEMVTRKRIFHDKDAVSIIGRVMQMPIKNPSEVLDDKYSHEIPPILEDAIMKAMERNVDKRFQSASEMREALKEIRNQLELGQTGRLPGKAAPAGPDHPDPTSGVHSSNLSQSGMSQSGLHSGLAQSGLVPGSGPLGRGNDTGRTGGTGVSAIYTRSGGFSLADSSRLATGLAAGTSILDQTFSIDELESSLAGERRKVAVLAIQQRARRKSGLDPEQLARRSAKEVAIIREVIEHFEGEVDSFLGGTYTVLFGARKARVGDNVRAIECALTLRKRFATLELGASHLGIGLAYGEVYLSDRKGGNAFGEAIDRAIEIARGATEAKVFADKELYDLTRQEVQFEAPQNIAGDAAAEVVQIRADAAVGTEDDGEIAEVYVPRPRYFDELMRRATETKNNNGGGVGIVGRGGTGKSTLLKHLIKDLKDQGWQGFMVRAGDVPSQQSLAAVRAIIRKVALTYKDPKTLIRKACESIGLTDGVNAVVALYLDRQYDAAEHGPLPWQDAKSFAHFTSALLHRIVRFAMKKGPVLLAIDDIDIEDKAQNEVLDGFLESIQNQPVLIVASRQMKANERDHRLPGNFEVMQVSEFDEQEARMFIQLSLGYTPPMEVVAHLFQRSSGNPMFLAEMVRALRKSDMTQMLTAEALEAAIPLSFHELLAERVDQLDDNARDLLAIASVLGESFREEFFYQVTPAHLGPQLGLEKLVKEGVFSARFDAFQRVYITFQPPELRKVAYDRVPRETRNNFHSRVIEFLEQEPDLAAADPLEWATSLAFHYRAVEGWEGSAHYLARAGDVLLDLYDYTGAISHYEEAKNLLDTHGYDISGAIYASVIARLLVALRESGRVDQALTLIDKFPDLDRIPAEFHATLLLEQGRVGLAAADVTPAYRALEKARDIALANHDIKLEVKVLLAQSELFEKENQLSHAGSLLKEVSQKVEQLQNLNMADPDDRKLYWTAYNQLGTLFIRQRELEHAKQFLNEALRRARDLQDQRGLIRILSNLGALCLSTRDVKTSKEYFGSALQFARGTGDLLNQSRILTNLGIANMEANEFDTSKKYFKQARAIAEEIGWHEGLADLSMHIKRLQKALRA